MISMILPKRDVSFIQKSRQTLEHIQKACRYCQNPEERIVAPIIHVAGTNGKGSTIAMIRAILEAKGLCVHVLTSPHLISFRERIVVAGKPISLDLWEQCNKKYHDCVPSDLLSYFEHMILIALMAFSRVPAHCILIETGLGGRLDATNIITPALTMITPISLDHQDVLGDHILSIAAEKAGIMKSHIPVIIGKQSPYVQAFLKRYGKERNSPMLSYGQDFFIKNRTYSCPILDTTISQLPNPNLKGEHQWDNGAMAITGILQLQKTYPFGIKREHFQEGFQHIQWQGRFQQLPSTSYLAQSSHSKHVILDVAHNRQSALILTQLIRQYYGQQYPMSIIVALRNNKPIESFLDALKEHIKILIAIPIDGGHQPEEIIKVSQKYSPSFSATSLIEGIKIVGNQRKDKNNLLIVGSHQIVGKALKIEKESSRNIL